MVDSLTFVGKGQIDFFMPLYLKNVEKSVFKELLETFVP